MSTDQKERGTNATEMTDQKILDMLSRIFGVGTEDELATAYSAH